jgi:hypothetical protein
MIYNSFMNRKQIVFFIFFLLIQCQLYAADYDGRFGWPKQEPPRKVIISDFGNSLAESMMAESLSGLTAQAVNAKKFDSMVWFDTNNESYRKIFEKSVEVLGIKDIQKMSVWDLLNYLKRKHVVKGYILYKVDKPRKNPYASNPNTDYSVNVATVYASLLHGVLADESLVPQMKQLGLKELKDARNESPELCFERNKAYLCRMSALSVPPSVHHLRDYAIAHRLMLFADDKTLANKVLEWVQPLSPILGWGCGDEYDFTSIIACWGDYNSASNWCVNLPFISSVSGKVKLSANGETLLKGIDFTDKSSFHSYVMSDGDNVQWAMGSYIDSENYMANPNCKGLGINWTLCATELSVLSPFTWNAAVGRQSSTNSIFEYGGGYQYPDIFAINRKNRTELLHEFARRLNYHFNQLNIKIFGFICKDVSSKEAQEAFQIYADEMPNLTGMIAVQYFPYELEGKIYWKTNKRGIDIPIVASRYSIWNEVNEYRPFAGVPEFVASLINRDEMAAREKDNSTLSWTIVHAWSNFSKSSRVTPLPAIGVNPVKATNDLLLPSIKSIALDELLWRIRMKYRPEQTKKLLNE